MGLTCICGLFDLFNIHEVTLVRTASQVAEGHPEVPHTGWATLQQAHPNCHLRQDGSDLICITARTDVAARVTGHCVESQRKLKSLCAEISKFLLFQLYNSVSHALPG